MKKLKIDGNLMLCFLINMMMHWRGTIPAWFLLAAHIWLDWSIWWFVGAFGIWLLWLTTWMILMGWANRCSTPDRPKQNKNPYSVGSNQLDSK